MERRRSTKSVRRSSIKRGKQFELVLSKPPLANIEFEDVLVSQLQISDVLNNCVLGDDSPLGFDSPHRVSPMIRKHQPCLYHRCYHNTTLVPLWQAFASQDHRDSGKILLGRLMHLSASLAPLLGAENHEAEIVQKHFIKFAQVPFHSYKQYVTETTAGRSFDLEVLSARCWAICKDRFLNNPLVDSLDSVVPPELADAIYWLFCVFNNLTEPDTYPPSMDYEETDLLLRKLFAGLGIPWTSNFEFEFSNPDDSDKTSEYEPPSPPMVTFQQFLYAIADMIGTDIARSHAFYRAVQRLCLSESMEVMKTGWLYAKKRDSENWKKRWAVLHGFKLTLYTSIICVDVKEEIKLSDNMHIESLPGGGSNKHRFRLVEKEGDFKILSEHEFSTSSKKGTLSWLTLLNLASKVYETGMSAKTSEICERRLERFQRRESEHEVLRKKREVLEAFNRLQEAKKARNAIEEALNQRAQERDSRMILLLKMDKIYERLETIQYQQSLYNKADRERGLLRVLSNFKRDDANDHYEDEPLSRAASESPERRASLKRLAAEKSQLEQALEDLRMTPNNLSSKPTILIHRSNSVNGSSCHDYQSSSENLSLSSAELTQFIVSDVTSHR